jgi:hypothetical protein
MEGFRKEHPEGDDLVWGAAATKWTISAAHIDDDGLSTAIEVKAGAKLWIVMRPKVWNEPHRHLGDLSSIHAFPNKFSMGDTGKEAFEFEGVLLVPGCQL